MSIENLTKTKNIENKKDNSPKSQPEKGKEKEKNDYEKIKEEFSLWIDSFLEDIYNDNFKDYKFCVPPDPVTRKIVEVLNINERAITKESRELSFIFGEKLVSFSNKMIFWEDYELKSKEFYNKIHTMLFSYTPDIFEYLNFPQKLTLFPKINETYVLRNIVDTPGELAYSLSFSEDDLEEVIEETVSKMESSEKIITIKQLARVSRAMLNDHGWMERAFRKTVNSLEKVKNEEQNPIVSFILKYELRDISRYSGKGFNDSYNVEIKTGEIFQKLEKETQEFNLENKISPNLEGTYYSQTSKDYGAIFTQNSPTSIGLVKHSREDKNLEKEAKQRETFQFSEEETKNLKLFLKEIDKPILNDQNWVDIASVGVFVADKFQEKDKNVKYIEKETLKELKETFSKMEELVLFLEEGRKDPSENIFDLEERVFTKYDALGLKVIKKSKNINVEELKRSLNSIIEASKEKQNILTLESYEGLTQNKALNPFGGEDFSNLVKIFHNPEIRAYINHKFGIEVENMYLKEQIHFLRYLSDLSFEKFDKVKNIFKENDKTQNEYMLRSSLSLSGDTEMGDKILTLGEKLPKSVAQKLFSKYSEIVDSVNKILEFSKTGFSREINTNPELISKIENTLYLKGKNILSQVYEDIVSNKEIDFNSVNAELDRINADTLTTFAIFKQAVKSGEKLPIESIEGSSFQKREATEIAPEKQKEMLNLYEFNWKHHADKEFVESLKRYFESSFIPEENKLKNKFYTFEKDNKIRAFIRFEEKEENHLHASALNVDEASKNFGLGEAMMDEALHREAKENILHASCTKDNPSNMRYFEKGFISKNFEVLNNTEGFELLWDEKGNQNILAKQKSKEELIKMMEEGKLGDLEMRKDKDLLNIHRDIVEGKALVRCFNDKYTGDWYAVYEKVGENYGTGVNSEEVE